MEHTFKIEKELKITTENIFEKGGIGVCSIGECWRLRLTFSNQQTLVACFVTYDDHHNAAKQYSLHGRIWSEREALSEANKMVAEFIED